MYLLPPVHMNEGLSVFVNMIAFLGLSDLKRKTSKLKKLNSVFIYVPTAASVFSNEIKPVDECPEWKVVAFFYSADALR